MIPINAVGLSLGDHATRERVERGKTDLVLLVEIAGRLSEQEARDRRATLQNHVFSHRGVLINRVAFVRKNALERTSSGKKRRQVIRERFVRQQLELS